MEDLEKELVKDSTIDISIPYEDASKKGLESVAKRFEKDDWNIVEQKLSDGELIVLQALMACGKNKGVIQDISASLLNTIGEKMYCEHRKLFEWLLYVPTTSGLKKKKDKKKTPDEKELINPVEHKKQKAGKPGSKKAQESNVKKADIIRAENTADSILTEIQKMISTMDKENYTIPYGKSSKVIEYRGISLLYMGWFIANNKVKLPFALTVITIFQKFLTVIKGYIGYDQSCQSKKIEISTTMISDLTSRMNQLIEQYSYNGDIIDRIAPYLIITAYDYDSMIPGKSVRAREHQNDTIKSIFENIDNGFIIRYSTPIGSGKTTLAVAIGELIRTLRKESPEKYSNLELIYSCSNKTIKFEVARLLYNAGIPFGIGNTIQNPKMGQKNYNIVNNYIVNNITAPRCVIVCDPNTGSEILKDNFDNKKYILFLDEPTVGADTYDSEGVKQNMEILADAPNNIILCSATLAPLEKIEFFTSYHLLKYPTAKRINITSNEIYIGCDVKTFSGNLVVPHLGCKTSKELLNVIDIVESTTFLGRIYSSNVVRQLCKTMKELDIDSPDIEELFNDITNMAADNVRKIAIDLLKFLTTQSDNIIKKVCETKIDLHQIETEKVPKKEKETFEGFEFDDQEKYIPETNTLEFTKLGTTDAYKCMGQTLIVSRDPVLTALNWFAPLLEIIKQEKIKSPTKIVADYEKAYIEYQKKIDHLEREALSEVDKDAKQEQIRQDYHPKFIFPDKYQINIAANLATFAKGRVIDRTNIRSKIELEYMCQRELTYSELKRKSTTAKSHQAHVTEGMVVSDDILTLLFCGIGIISPEHKLLDDRYMSCVLELASEGKLAYLLSDASICYGTNHPTVRVIVAPDFSNLHSINTLFQLFGRAGRVNKSWKAEVYISDDIAREIITFANGSSDAGSIEEKNMKKSFEEIITKRNEAVRIALEAEIQKQKKLEEEKLFEEQKQKQIQERAALFKKLEEEKLAREKQSVQKIISLSTLREKIHDSDNRSDSKIDSRTWKRSDDSAPTISNNDWRNIRDKKPPSDVYVPPFKRDRNIEPSPKIMAPDVKNDSKSSGWKRK